MIVHEGEIFYPYSSVDNALTCAMNSDDPDQKRVLGLAGDVLCETEELILLARYGRMYEITDGACSRLADQFAEALSYDKGLVHDVLREALPGLPLTRSYERHRRRLSVSRKQMTLWKKAILALVAAAELHAKNELSASFVEAGLMADSPPLRHRYATVARPT